MKNLRGRVALVLTEDDFDIDQIVGVENAKLTDPAELAALALEWCGEEFRQRVRPGDLIVGGRNFGYGHPHYPTNIAMRHLGLAGVIAEFFSPGYWLGEIAKGFPQIACEGILASVERWDDVEVDWTNGLVQNHTRGTSLPFSPLTESELATLEAGGLNNYLKARAKASATMCMPPQSLDTSNKALTTY